ncbi:MAG TPA: ECF-type sigma factor [Casimicrobiaceae bacterium]|nr:ECF-type sigma factor [Casimicrobiaceae bacterium]
MTAEQTTDATAVATLIKAAEQGQHGAASALFTSLYNELHRVAARQLRVAAAGSTLGATTLLHECYLNLAERDPAFPDRARFIAYAARAMRGLIVDYIRERRALKRGGEFHLTALDTEVAKAVPEGETTVKLADALDALSRTDAALAELVDLKFFCGFAFREIAAMRQVSERTEQRDWQKARLLLHQALEP